MAKLRDAAETLGGCLLYAAFLSIPIILILAFVKRSTRMTIRKRGARYHYDFMIRWQRYRGALPEARTKAEAQQAEAKIKNKIYERKYGKTSASRSFANFVESTYLPWAKATKRSSRDDVLHERFSVVTSGTRM